MLAEVILMRCEPCRLPQVTALADSTPGLARLVELVGRAHTGRYAPLRGLASNDGRDEIAGLADMDPAGRASALEGLDRSTPIAMTDTAAALLVGVWSFKHLAAEAPATAAAEARRFAERYGLTGAEAGWAWAAFRLPEPGVRPHRPYRSADAFSADA